MTEQNPNLMQLRKKAMELPPEPGVYIMRGKAHGVIYVGKAKSLKNRVSQYFGSDKNHLTKVQHMVLHVVDFDYIVTDSEFEALVLENSLIKQHQPKYNIILKDDKGYSYIRVEQSAWPRITEVKQILQDGARYIGPYMSAWSVKQAVDEARKIFLLPTCNRKFPQDFGKGRPCLNFFIKQCCAPCRGKIKEADYATAVNEALEFMKGGAGSGGADLEARMQAAAENLDFETAARLRDRIAAIKRVQERQKVVQSTIAAQDVIALAMEQGKAAVTVLVFRESRLKDRRDFLFEDADNAPKLRGQFIAQYYSAHDAPPRIAVDGPVEDTALLTRWLTQKNGRKVELHLPQKGDQLKLVEMCRQNAAEKLSEGSVRTGREISALDELGRMLGLASPPDYIEAYDISNLSGGENVGAMVVFASGRPLKAAYRKFKIKTVIGQDDYGSMQEIITRRFQQYQDLKETNEGFGRMPDLILLDGGKGHVGVIAPTLQAMGYQVPVFGMVKDDKHRTRAIALSGGEIAISASRRAFTLISNIQDEVHRFAIGFHRQQRKKSTFSSSLLTIEGIGENRARALLKQFKTIGRIAQATPQELAVTPGMNRAAANRVYDFYHEGNATKVD